MAKTQKYRTYNITLNYDYEIHDEQGSVTSDLTEKQWKENIKQRIALNISDKDWCAYAFHDKDILTDGLPKPLHVHILVGFENARHHTAVMKRFNVSRPENCQNTKKIANSARYLTHRTEQAMIDGKYPYEVSSVHTVNCDYLNLIKGKEKSNAQKEIDEFVADISEEIMNGNLYVSNIRDLFFKEFERTLADKLYKKYRKEFEKDFQEYLQHKGEEFKIKGRNLATVYIWGVSEGGKSHIAKRMGLLLTDRLHLIPASGKNKTFDPSGLYQGEGVSIFNEISGKEFNNKEFLGLADPKNYSPINSRGKDKHWLASYLFLTSTDSREAFIKNLMPKLDPTESFEQRQIKRHEIARRVPYEIRCTSLGYMKTQFHLGICDSKNQEMFSVGSVICEHIDDEKEMQKAALEILKKLGLEK
ncbi:Rep family protein [Lactococcus formosensis subsp. bovis]|uniref:Rep family protein n=1 Tax=Lactococcus formosensis TaxID=1281486 RepID=UPI001BCB3B70|nr:Rep family protein [Lactococcus formosensis]